MFRARFTYSIVASGWVAHNAGYEWLGIVRRKRLPLFKGRIVYVALGRTREEARQSAEQWMRLVGPK